MHIAGLEVRHRAGNEISKSVAVTVTRRGDQADSVTPNHSRKRATVRIGSLSAGRRT